MRLRGPLSAAAVVLFATTARTAVIQKDSEGGIVTISKGMMMKQFPSGQKAVFDSKLGLVTAVFPATRTYTTFSKEQFCAAAQADDGSSFFVRESSPLSVLDILSGGYIVEEAEPYRVDESQKSFRVLEVVQQREAGAPAGPPKVKVVEGGTGGTVAGFKTKRYRIYVNGEMEDEIWMATDRRILEEVDDLDMPTILGFFQCGEEVTAGAAGVAENPEYRKLFERGWPLRIKSGVETYYKVLSIEIRDVPAAEFGVPKRYDGVPFSRMALGIDRDEE